ncbi:hypothetical protein IC229_33565 [Spirosoma sp. BT702]|uniref:Uncharacterized protein n=1 Tax=Spirosoma profusum TaxID=2771354 RepID=A0A927AW84_9BACT|nr:hypothetical protein [Spirosoma profusum]MBD2705585.1 hypothetical protein [Spirosoma profusum]
MKFYQITILRNRAHIQVGIVKASSHDKAFEVFKEKSVLTDEVLYSEILTPERLHKCLKAELPGQCLIGAR